MAHRGFVAFPGWPCVVIPHPPRDRLLSPPDTLQMLLFSSVFLLTALAQAVSSGTLIRRAPCSCPATDTAFYPFSSSSGTVGSVLRCVYPELSRCEYSSVSRSFLRPPTTQRLTIALQTHHTVRCVLDQRPQWRFLSYLRKRWELSRHRPGWIFSWPWFGCSRCPSLLHISNSLRTLQHKPLLRLFCMCFSHASQYPLTH